MELTPIPVDLDLVAERRAAIEAVCGALAVPFTPTYIGSTTTGCYRYDCACWQVEESGHVTVQGTLTFQADARAPDQSLSCLRYPPKEPARGSVSRRREKLRKAGIR